MADTATSPETDDEDAGRRDFLVLAAGGHGPDLFVQAEPIQENIRRPVLENIRRPVLAFSKH